MSLTGDTLELIQARRRRIDVEEEFDIIRSNDNDLDFEDPTEVAARSLKLKTAKSTVKKTKKKLGAAISSEDEEQDTAIVEDIASELDKIEIKGAVIKATKGIVKADLRNLESGKLLNTALFDPKLLEDNLQSTDFDGKAIAASLVWVPSKIDAWMPAKVIQFDQGVAVVKVIGGDVLVLKDKEVQECKDAHISSITEEFSNLSSMVEFSEGAMIYQIRNRYKRDKIYTNIGDILISVNPFKLVNLYGKEHFALYKDKLASMKGEPHLFQVASRAYWNLISDKVDQSIIISGESGSGKTESTKLVLKFLSRIAGSGNGVEQQILMSNPILESFGNAKTLRNNNSSRFGKWMEVKFDQFGMICGGKIVNYLLEKSRVVSQINDERNYHAFYQLCAGASLEMRNKYRIMDADKYFYLNQSKCLKIEGFDDEQNFKELMIALRDLKFSEEDISEIIRILACILHIGNMALITPHDDTERTIIKDKVHREFVAELLGIEGDALEKAICYRIIVVRGEEQVVKLKLEQSLEARDSLAKSLYERMFDWLVVRINQFLLQKNSKSSIGILDIFGFEVFQKNSFEQFCINFANEQLQHHFIDYIFTMERNEYKEEKIDVVSSNFVENLDALNLLSAIIDKMDEEVMLLKGSDMYMVEKIHKEFLSGKTMNPALCAPDRLRLDEFTIKHYAGQVTYHVIGFLDKCRDTIHDSLLIRVRQSKSPLIGYLYRNALSEDDKEDLTSSRPVSPSSAKSNARKGSLSKERKKKNQTIGSSFRVQLNDLMIALRKTNPSFIKCIKPNDFKSPNKFDSVSSLSQMKNSGLFAAVKVRAAGYAYRKPHAMFFTRYKVLLPSAVRKRIEVIENNRAKVERILIQLKNLPQEKKHVQIGETKIFYSAAFMQKLEEAREEKMNRLVVILQTCTRVLIAKKRAKKVRKYISQLQGCLESGDTKQMQEVRRALKNDPDIIDHYLTQFLDSNLKEISEQSHWYAKVQDALKQKEKSASLLNSLIQDTEKMNLKNKPRKPQYIDILSELILERDLLAEKESAFKKLNAAFSHENYSDLKEGIMEAKKFGIKDIDLTKYLELLNKLAEEEKIFDALRRAMKNGVSTSDLIERVESLLEKSAGFHRLSNDHRAILKQANVLVNEYYSRTILEYLENDQEDSLKIIIDKLVKKGYSADIRKEFTQAQQYLQEKEKIRQVLRRQEYLQGYIDKLKEQIIFQQEEELKNTITSIENEGLSGELKNNIKEAKEFLKNRENDRQMALRSEKINLFRQDLNRLMYYEMNEHELKELIQKIKSDGYYDDLRDMIMPAESKMKEWQISRHYRERVELIDLWTTKLKKFLETQDLTFDFETAEKILSGNDVNDRTKDLLDQAAQLLYMVQNQRNLIVLRESELNNIIDLNQGEQAAREKINQIYDEDISVYLKAVLERAEMYLNQLQQWKEYVTALKEATRAAFAKDEEDVLKQILDKIKEFNLQDSMSQEFSKITDYLKNRSNIKEAAAMKKNVKADKKRKELQKMLETGDFNSSKLKAWMNEVFAEPDLDKMLSKELIIAETKLEILEKSKSKHSNESKEIDPTSVNKKSMSLENRDNLNRTLSRSAAQEFRYENPQQQKSSSIDRKSDELLPEMPARELTLRKSMTRWDRFRRRISKITK